MDEDRPLVRLVVVHFTCPTISSVPHYCTVSTFHRLSQFVLRMQRFRYVLVGNHMQKYNQEGFFKIPQGLRGREYTNQFSLQSKGAVTVEDYWTECQYYDIV